MKKFVKIILVLLIAVFPKVVDAASGSVTLSCPAKINVSSAFKCTIRGTSSDGAISGFQSALAVSSGLTCNSVSSTNFTANLNGTTLLAELKNAAIASPATIAELSCSVKANASGNQTISLSGNKMGIETAGGTEKSSPATASASIHINSAVNTLNSLSLSEGTLSPAFSTSVTSYTATVNAASVTITAVKTDSSSTVTGAGAISLKYGVNTINVVVKSETGVSKTYKIVITRPDVRENVNTLKSLSANVGTLSPSFSAATTNYKLTVASNVTQIILSASLTSTKSSFVSGLGPRTVNLNYGVNKIYISVSAENETIKKYTIEVTRQDNRNADATLSSITLSTGSIPFDKNVTEYTLNVPYETESITVNGAATASTSKVVVNGGKTLVFGDNKVTITVTAENGTTKTYTIIVKRIDEQNVVFSSNKNLKSMTIQGHKLEFSNDIKEYRVKLKEGETALKLDYLLEDEKSTVQVIGNENLKDGSIVKIVVTAEDNTTSTYQIVIEQAAKVANWKIFLSIISILIIIGGIIFINIKVKKKK